jgi:hypothetical protein
MLRNVDGVPQRGATADLRAPTINIKKHRRRITWEVVPEIRERPPSTLKNVDGGPLGGGVGDPGAPIINAKNVDDGPPDG